ncbi:MAG: methyl-accepting chemotaxis protein [Desulforhopalus sp.]|jgi:methyl-accepting chemotaxis protein
MGKTIKRRKYFIKKDYQGKLLLSCFLIVVGGGLLFNVLLGLLSADSVTISYSNQELQLGRTPFMLFKQGLAANWILIILGGGFVMVASLLLSHRVMGPMYRFEATLDDMLKGELGTTIHLRDKDQGKELAQKINGFNSQVFGSFREIRKNNSALKNLIEQTAALELPEEEKEQLASLCWSMQEHNRKITKSCNYYTGRDE